MATDPRYAAGQVVGGKLICGAKKKDGTPCKMLPMAGATRCRRHGGASPRSKIAAAKRVAETEAREQLTKGVRTLGLPQDIDPGKALLNEIHHTAGHVAWLRDKVQELKADDLVWGVTQKDEGIGPQGMVDMTTQKAAPSIWYELYLKERDHLAKVCALALRAGIEERKIKLAEDQGALVADVIKRILAALGLTPEQQALVPTIVPQQLRLLAGGNDS
ncbi:HGGxSTG domain-containing protein [Pseudarthrobacter sp. PS3-L1]|uniref:HGGxSTG domain-containing protein n=1 Tax=Pseudarthrobacter sp. PS3-L1 TaxID=3046207 RepID=UPI0024BAEC9B|nr:HGGxSTG domain-containing protein [Pseudarthrobacter sp. PS3-L1]MDJ0321845.1 HGGxSTG domain-containing protein [Pseudarthrobacter sp. PS3-L1]